MIHLKLPDKQSLAAEELARITEARRAKEMDYRRNRACVAKVLRRETWKHVVEHEPQAALRSA